MNTPGAFKLDLAYADIAQEITALPSGPGVYMLAAPDKPPHLSWSANLRRRLARLFHSPDSAPNSLLARLRNSLASVECWPTGSKLESSLLMYRLAKTYFPGDYLARLRLRMPWFVVFTSYDPFPRLAVVNRPSRNAAPQFGPFSSRDSAQSYEQEVLALFQLRRCTETLAPHPEHPGCIYGEMNQCLRPCQTAVSIEEYRSESERVAEFLSSNGKSALSVLSAARDRACEDTDFEQAAHIHKRIEKVSAAVQARDGVITEIHQLNGVALTRAVEARCFRLWPMLGGFWQQPLELSFSAEESRPKSLDHELRERLGESLSHARAEGKRIEDLAIFSRWYYSSWRDGEWFPFRTLADLNYRRLVREISKLVRA
ncbi:MAG: hypothetical protein WB992_01435 [Bryobacteraceae bacterium]